MVAAIALARRSLRSTDERTRRIGKSVSKTSERVSRQGTTSRDELQPHPSYPLRTTQPQIKPEVITMNLRLGLLCVPFFVLATADVFATDGGADPDSEIRDLCQNGRPEGAYMQSFVNDIGNAFLICTSASSMVAVVRSKNGHFDLTMAHTAINGDNLYFVTFDPSDDGARGALGNTPDPRLKLSISALRQGIMQGEYRSMILRKPVVVSASRAVGFPNLIAQANPAFDYRMITGQFVIDHIDQLKRVEAVAPAYVAIESIGPRLRVNLNDSGTIKYGLYNGISAKDADNIVYASSGVDDSLGGKNPFVHVRGYLVDIFGIIFLSIPVRNGRADLRSQGWPAQPAIISADGSTKCSALM